MFKVVCGGSCIALLTP
nr:hypothetical protein [Vibrio alginolyticus]